MTPAAVFDRQRANASAMARTTAQQRRERLRRLGAAITRRRAELAAAVRADLAKSDFEIELSETHVVLGEIAHAIRHLGRWMRPRRTGASVLFPFASCRIVYEPKGVVLILSAWNYPFALALAPVVGALAAGNCVIIKPSEKAPSTALFLASLIAEVFPSEECAVVTGGVETARELVAMPFDHILFTGSAGVAREVLRAAADNLTPVTLELGGKSPAIVEVSADVRSAAEYVVWGRCFSAGQSCLAPDYVLVHESLATRFLDECKRTLDRYFGPDGAARRSSPDLARIVDDAHFERLTELIRTAVAAGATIVSGGEWDPTDRYVAPTILAEVSPESSVMQGEIFGPVLPVLSVKSRAEAIEFVTRRPRPLALYLFARDPAAADAWLRETRSGAAVINGTMLHYGVPQLPFGGVGESGMGGYHGEHGFRAFSNARAVMYHRAQWLYRPLFPPYNSTLTSMTRWLLRRLAP